MSYARNKIIKILAGTRIFFFYCMIRRALLQLFSQCAALCTIFFFVSKELTDCLLVSLHASLGEKKLVSWHISTLRRFLPSAQKTIIHCSSTTLFTLRKDILLMITIFLKKTILPLSQFSDCGSAASLKRIKKMDTTISWMLNCK